MKQPTSCDSTPEALASELPGTPQTSQQHSVTCLAATWRCWHSTAVDHRLHGHLTLALLMLLCIRAFFGARPLLYIHNAAAWCSAQQGLQSFEYLHFALWESDRWSSIILSREGDLHSSLLS